MNTRFTRMCSMGIVALLGVGDPRAPVGRSEADRRVGEERLPVVHDPAGMVEVQVGAHHDVDVLVDGRLL